ncbi:hypothetical protein [Bacillus cytotoxicus]|uniref:hypothetical protein n=1 Tax=Bacillus cytotoxicus TaxID=580165 RepID=UPI00244B0640|nr:hypothetical protein [Bacillus cytotoxicus]MDH2881884.1 hypothetical protein [Bacillus cytotoxicus]
MRTLSSIISQPAHIGMLPTLYSVTSSMVKGGQYISPDGKGGKKDYSKSDESIEKLYDSRMANKL